MIVKDAVKLLSSFDQEEECNIDDIKFLPEDIYYVYDFKKHVTNEVRKESEKKVYVITDQMRNRGIL